MKTISVYEAEGMVLGHDMTQIIPGKFKGRAFKKGHIISKEDINQLLDMGKEHIYVFDLKDGLVHEDDAARRIAQLASGSGVVLSGPKEGKVELIAGCSGLLKVNTGLLYALNEDEEIIFATLHSNQHVKERQVLAGTRIIPLVIDENRLRRVEELFRNNSPLISVKPYHSFDAGLITTGSEVFSGRIEDKFGPVVKEKIEKYGSRIMRQVLVSDCAEKIAAEITALIQEGAEMILVTGGMSVDPEDVTPMGIRLAGGKVVTYGAPVLPGAMLMLAYIEDVPVMGLPGCVMYNRISSFDLVLPRILAGERVSRKDIISFAQGGLCTNCEVCQFPNCGFGKGGY